MTSACEQNNSLWTAVHLNKHSVVFCRYYQRIRPSPFFTLLGSHKMDLWRNLHLGFCRGYTSVCFAVLARHESRTIRNPRNEFEKFLTSAVANFKERCWVWKFSVILSKVRNCCVSSINFLFKISWDTLRVISRHGTIGSSPLLTLFSLSANGAHKTYFPSSQIPSPTTPTYLILLLWLDLLRHCFGSNLL
jgi:hypothetical protein